jgi:hypothetical protein
MPRPFNGGKRWVFSTNDAGKTGYLIQKTVTLNYIQELTKIDQRSKCKNYQP